MQRSVQGGLAARERRQRVTPAPGLQHTSALVPQGLGFGREVAVGSGRFGVSTFSPLCSKTLI